jgi:hypothetical protein
MSRKYLKQVINATLELQMLVYATSHTIPKGVIRLVKLLILVHHTIPKGCYCASQAAYFGTDG